MSIRGTVFCGLVVWFSVALPTGCSRKGISIRSRKANGFFPWRTCGRDQRTHEISAKHPTRLFKAMSEPVLCSKEWSGRTVFRLLIVPPWGEPVCVRLERRPDGTCQGTVTVLHPTGGYETGFKPGEVKRKDTVQLSARQWNRLGKTIRETGFLDLPTCVGHNVGAADGITAIAEFVKGGKYRAVYRWGGRTENRAFNLVGKEVLETVGLSRDLIEWRHSAEDRLKL